MMKKAGIHIVIFLLLFCSTCIAEEDSVLIEEIKTTFREIEMSSDKAASLPLFKSKIDSLIAVSSKSGEHYSSGIGYRYLSLYYILRNEPSEFLPNIEISTKHFEKIDEYVEIVKNELNSGNFYLQNSEYDKLGSKSFTRLYKALELSQEIRAVSLTVSAQFYLGYMYQNKFSEYPEAVKSYNNAIELIEEGNVDFPIWKIYNNISNCYIHIEEYEQAGKYIDEMRKILEERQLTPADWRMYYLNSGILESQLGNYEIAEKLLNSALKSAIEFNDKQIVELSWQNLIKLCRESNNSEEEEKLLRNSTKYFADHKILDLRFLHSTQLADFLYRQNRGTEGDEELANISSFLPQISDYEILKRYYRIRSDRYYSINDFKNALMSEKKFITYRDSIRSEKEKLAHVRMVSRQSLSEKKAEIIELQEDILHQKTHERDLIIFSILIAVMLISIIVLYVNLNKKKHILITEQDRHIEKISQLLQIKNRMLEINEDETENIEDLLDWAVELLQIFLKDCGEIDIYARIGKIETNYNPLKISNADEIIKVEIENCQQSGELSIKGTISDSKMLPHYKHAIKHFAQQISNILRFIEVKQDLKDSEYKFRSIFNQIHEGLCIIDLSGKIIEWNKEAQLISDYSREQVINLPIRDVTTRLIPDLNIDDILHFDFPYNEDFELVTETNRVIKLKTVPLKIKDIDHLCLSFTDITEEIELKKQVHLSEKMASLGIMTTGIAHEINQPLTTITFIIENLIRNLKAKTIDHENVLKKINNLQTSMDRLSEFIQKILTYSSQKITFSEKFDLNSRIDKALDWNLTQATNNYITLKRNYSKQNMLISGSSVRFDEIIINLISNAIVSLKNKPDNRMIEITTEYRSGYAYFMVKDNGIGIEKKEIEKIFLPFYSNRKNEDSTGLGLSIVFNIIKEMKGEISVASEPGEWSEFTVALPCEIKDGDRDVL